MKTFMKLLVLSAPLLLAACGEGYEMIRTDTMFPYGNQRTAGSGVAYVRAKMLPEKDLVLKTVSRDHAPKAMMQPVEPVAEPIASAEQVFNDAQAK